jgi:uroporphyrinogen-III synthase
MAILVTRPHPDNEATAARLRARGFEVLLAPMLRFEPVAFRLDTDSDYGGIVLTSANSLRAVNPQLADSRLLALPLFAVGDHTAAAARDAGFTKVIVAGGDAANLRPVVRDSVRDKALKKASSLLYLAGADLSRDIAVELGEEGFAVVTQTTYRMVPITSLAREACDGFAAHEIKAVLHYSRRSARAFVDAVRAEGVEVSALAIPQCCISSAVASILHDAGAAQVTVAASPDENALFGVLDRALRP